MRRAQWLAMGAAVCLLALNSGPEVHGDSVPSVDAAPTVLEGPDARAELMARLSQRNPRLGSVRAQRIADAVLRCTREQDIPELTPHLMLAVMFKESDARPHVHSPKGAIGLMQVMPYMFRVLEIPGGIAHLETNIEAGCLVLADNIRRLGYQKGVSAYFWGNQVLNTDYQRGVDEILRDLGPVATTSEPESEDG